MWRPAESMARHVRVAAPTRHNGAMSRTTLPILLLAACLGIGVLPTAHAQASAGPASEASERPHYDTGDAWLDRQLADIDRYASAYPETFAAEVERYAGASRAYVRGLIAQPGWNAGDAWYACFLARALQTDCRSVVRARARLGRQGGWTGVVAELRAENAADPHYALRLSMADSYRRWGRDLQPDAALRRALQQREREFVESGRQ